MPLTAQQGYAIREEHAGVREAAVCAAHGLVQRGGSQTKVDGENSTERKSIKNAKGASTQVHLTTQKKFIDTLSAPQEFIKRFCGSPDLDNRGIDRYYANEIDTELTQEFITFLEDNKKRIIDLVISNGCGITSVVYRDITNEIEYELTYEDILRKVESCRWVMKKGGIHLKDSNNKTYFHLQREGKRNPRNRYNILFHIHRALFL